METRLSVSPNLEVAREDLKERCTAGRVGHLIYPVLFDCCRLGVDVTGSDWLNAFDKG